MGERQVRALLHFDFYLICNNIYITRTLLIVILRIASFVSVVYGTEWAGEYAR